MVLGVQIHEWCLAKIQFIYIQQLCALASVLSVSEPKYMFICDDDRYSNKIACVH